MSEVPLNDAELIRQMAAYIAGMETPEGDEDECADECENCAVLRLELDNLRAEMRTAQSASNVVANRAAEEIRGLKRRLEKQGLDNGPHLDALERLVAAGVEDVEGQRR